MAKRLATKTAAGAKAAAKSKGAAKVPVKTKPATSAAARAKPAARPAPKAKATKPASRAGAAPRRGRVEPLPHWREIELSTLEIEFRNGIAIVILARPEVHNAFDETLIDELTVTLHALEQDPEVRVVVLAGAGKSFCAGADLQWMQRMAKFSKPENLADARRLATMMRTLAGLSKPTIARVHGAAYGGGVGLVACCDIAIAAQEASFAFSEAKLGLIPATIGPYVVEAIGPRNARRYFLTAERFDAAEAYRIGLVHDIVLAGDLDARINELLGALLQCGPDAQAECKALVRGIAHRPLGDDLVEGTAAHIAAVRSAPEGREGVAAFLGKRKPAWVPQPPPAPVPGEGERS